MLPSENDKNKTKFLPTAPAGGGASSGARARKLRKNYLPATLGVINRPLPYADVTPFPNQAIVKLRFSQRFYTSPSATRTQIGTPYIFQPNSTYEPLDGATDQPYGRDQMALLYAKYKVLSVKITVQSLSDVGPTIAFVLAQSPTGAISMTGADGGQTACRPNVASYVVPNGSAGALPVTFTRTYQMHELLGVSKKEFDANTEEYAAAVAANPVQMPLIHIASCSFTNDNNSCYHLVMMEQEVQFFGRIGQALS